MNEGLGWKEGARGDSGDIGSRTRRFIFLGTYKGSVPLHSTNKKCSAINKIRWVCEEGGPLPLHIPTKNETPRRRRCLGCLRCLGCSRCLLVCLPVSPNVCQNWLRGAAWETEHLPKSAPGGCP